jgi:hypothetical protein
MRLTAAAVAAARDGCREVVTVTQRADEGSLPGHERGLTCRQELSYSENTYGIRQCALS